MKKVILFTVFGFIMFSSTTLGWAEERNAAGDALRSLQEMVGPKEGNRAEDREYWSNEVRDRINEVNRKVNRGVKRGYISKHEAREYKDNFNDILDKVERMRNDGQISQREKDRIVRDIDSLERRISEERSNYNRRY